MDSTSIIEALQSGATNVVGYFVNFSGEFGVIEQVLLVAVAPAIGFLISMWGVIDLIKFKKRGQTQASPASIVVKFIVGPITIQLSLLIRTVSESVFGERDFAKAEMLAGSYAEQASTASADPLKSGLLALVAFLVVVGWVSAIRAMVAFARIGTPSENGYELFRTGAARLVAATFLCMFQFVIDDLVESIGGGARQFSSALGL